jgi:hypothetical protein
MRQMRRCRVLLCRRAGQQRPTIHALAEHRTPSGKHFTGCALHSEAVRWITSNAFVSAGRSGRCKPAESAADLKLDAKLSDKAPCSILHEENPRQMQPERPEIATWGLQTTI